MAGILPLCPLRAQYSVEGWAQGWASIQPTLFCFVAQCLLRPEKMRGLLIISILNGLFRTGRVKVRGLEINHTDSSFPPVELAVVLVSVGSLSKFHFHCNGWTSAGSLCLPPRNANYNLIKRL